MWVGYNGSSSWREDEGGVEVNVFGIVLLSLAGLAFLPLLVLGLVAIGGIFYDAWKEDKGACIGVLLFLCCLFGGIALVAA